ncbi:unnamed protein product [Lepeophtheirus salmonis]|uniref:(salmon louse) hypothetical protein n=1 Tax=Lepeophtheirus salmonis TaxID=72036 RepID=A0A7R8CAA3_LEPSM|nr:unnamed protein product [Lepeophtheirus salmonis]CAF2749131.1 unnamed protein product [Lepeophtheirus salmonis]
MSSNPTTTETGGGESGSSSEYEFIENSKKLPPPSALPMAMWKEDEDNLSSFGFGWMSASSSGGLLSKMGGEDKEFLRDCGGCLRSEVQCHSRFKNAFRSIFGTKTAVYGLPSKTESIAEQPVGFAAGRQGAKERMNSLSSDADVKLSLENFLLEVGEDTWVEMIVLILLNSKLDITVTTYSQPVYVDVRFVDVAKEGYS